LPGFIYPQDIVQAEYFFDEYVTSGNGIPLLAEESGDTVEFNMDVDVTNLSSGPHLLYLRVKDENGFWSFPYTRTFIRINNDISNPDIAEAEYFFDDYVKQGEGLEILVDDDNDSTSINYLIPVEELSPGPHVLHLRVRDKNGMWSFPYAKIFIKMLVEKNYPAIASYKYAIDDFTKLNENETIIDEEADSVELDLSFDVSGLSPGPHILFFKIKDETGMESFIYKQTFIKLDDTPPVPIVKLEYFFVDTAKNILGIYTMDDFEPTHQLELTDYNFLLDPPDLKSNNRYELHVRLLDSVGIRSHFMIDTFTFRPGTEPHVVNSIPDQETNVGDYFQVSFSYDDFETPNEDDTLIFSAMISGGSELPEWLDFNPKDRIFSGIPNASDTGVWYVHLTATNRDGESVVDEFVITVLDPTGVFPPQGVHLFSVFPNPADSELSFTIDKEIFDQDGIISIYTLEGKAIQIIKNLKSEKYFTIDVSGFTPGYYIVSYQYEDFTIIKKIMIK
jgi:hypothetical protein